MTILAIDPGREKCGVAVVRDSICLHKSVISRGDAARISTALVEEHSVDEVIIGNGTGGDSLVDELHESLSIPIQLVDETLTTMRARPRFFQENPPRGIRRLIPRGLLAPDRPIDDYVALILAEEYLSVISNQ